MKQNKLLLLVFLFFLITGSLIMIFSRSFSKEIIIYNYDNRVLAAADINLPLPKPSTISTTENDVRLDLEKISAIKYYIVYSVIYGDQSHTAYQLYLTDLNREKIDINKIKEIWLETDNNQIEPVAQEPVITGFPEDEPLGWKVGILVKFPYQKTRDSHDLVLHYNNLIFRLTGISY
ncbi:MAG: hypothetical protein ACOCRZ_01970 [Halothermotrichaceae bacterium]